MTVENRVNGDASPHAAVDGDGRERAARAPLPRSREDEIRDTLAAMHGRMIDVVRPMTSADRASVIGFLRAMQEAVDEIDR